MRTFLILTLMAFSLISCGPKKKNNIVIKENSEFIEEANLWSLELTKDGHKMGTLILEMVDEKTDDPAKLDAAIVAFGKKLDDKVEYYRDLTPPAASVVYRDLFVDYLLWQKVAAQKMQTEVVPLAIDWTGSREERVQKVFTKFSEINEVEMAWKKKLQECQVAVFKGIHK